MGTRPDTVEVVIVEDHAATLDGLRSAINAQPDLRVAGVASSCREGMLLVRQLHPQVLILDLNLPDGNGWMLLENLRSERCLPPTLVLSVCDESVYARRLLRCGARGYLMKDVPLAGILSAIRQIRAGHFVAGPAICSQLMAEALDLDVRHPIVEPPQLAEALSDRELLVSGLLARNLTNREVGIQLGLSEKTVHTYKARIMTKLGVQTTPELVSRLRLLDRSEVVTVHQKPGYPGGSDLNS